jgi:long-chain fatty acid transport protein
MDLSRCLESMKTKTKSNLIGFVVACSAALAPSAHAAGIGLYEIATPDLGLAAAGYAARANDASTLFTNPAGMSRLQDSEFAGGVQLLYGSVEFRKEPSLTGVALRGSGDGGNAIGLLPGASAFFVQPLSDRIAVGLGTFSYFGLVSEYDDDWAGRYYIQKGALLGMSLMPAVSVRITDWLSVGAGLNAMFGYLDSEVAIRTGGAGDGQMKLKDNTWGFGANVGILVEPREGTRLGLTYLSPVELDFSDTPVFSNLGPLAGRPIFTSPPELDLGLTVPQSVMLSVYQQINPCWALLANVGWQNWDQFGKVDIGVDSDAPTSFTTELQYKDTWHAALGAQYKLSDAWLFSAGFAYDSSAVDDENRTLALPMGEAWRIGLGAQWQVSSKINLAAAYEFLWGGDMPVDQDSVYRGRVAGTYEDAWFSFFTVNMNWRF